MTTTRTFHLGDVLSVTTGFLVSPRHMDAFYDVLNFMTGDNLFTQLPRACRECAPEILRQHPDLASVVVPPEFEGKEHVEAWLAEQIAKFGESRELAPMNAADHTVIDPIAEMRMLRPDMPVIVVAPGDGTR